MQGSRARVVVALLGAAALFAAVLALRGQVEPTAAPAEATRAGSPDSPSAEQPLPVRPSRREPDWRRYPLPPGSMQVRADRSHLTMLQVNPSEQLPGSTVLVISRQTGQPVLSYRPEPGWHPQQWLLHGGGLVVLELRQPAGETHPRWDETARLRWVELGTAAARELPLSSMQAMRPDGLLAAGEDVLVATRSDSPTRTCVVAVPLSGRAERTVQCEHGHNWAVVFVEGASGPRWAFAGEAAGECPQWHELTGDGSPRPLAGGVGPCPDWSESQLGGWTVRAQYDFGDRPPRLRAHGSGGAELTLDEAGIPGLACGDHYYWTGFDDRRPRVLQWRPASDHSHVVFAAGRNESVELHPQSCTDGVLTLSVYLSPAGSTLAQAWVLDQP